MKLPDCIMLAWKKTFFSFCWCNRPGTLLQTSVLHSELALPSSLSSCWRFAQLSGNLGSSRQTCCSSLSGWWPSFSLSWQPPVTLLQPPSATARKASWFISCRRGGHCYCNLFRRLSLILSDWRAYLAAPWGQNYWVIFLFHTADNSWVYWRQKASLGRALALY